ncbi:MAG: hypothetical protein ABI441_03520 [Flavobacterium sp.]
MRTQNNGSAMGIAYAAYYGKQYIKAFDDKIDDSKLPPCLKKILNDLKKVGTSPGNMIAKFTGDPWSANYNWTMEQGKTSPDVPAHTLANSYNANTGIKTVFDVVSYTNATELSWAKTILHESIHSYLTTYYIRNQKDMAATYPQMLEEWGKSTFNKAQHEEIARTLINSISVALENYGIDKGYKLDRQFYQDMALGGLEETDVFKALPEAQRKRISDTVNIELHGKDMEGKSKPQKSKKAGC